MKTTFAALGLVLAAAGMTLSPAFAGDMPAGPHGGIKDGAGGVPVPAPIPYEEHYKYYIGAGLGWSFMRSGDVSGIGVGGAAMTTIPMDDFVGPATVSLTVGRYLTPSLRLELGIDIRTKNKVHTGVSSYETTLYGDGGNVTITDLGGNTIYSGPSHRYNVYDVTHTERAHTQTHNFMLNAVHEFNRGGRFTPYIGAGVGVALHMLHREARDQAQCINGRSGNDVYDAYGVVQPRTCWSQTDLPTAFTGQSKVSSTGVGLAAALMAGLTYNLNDRTHLDVGYRFIWQGGKVVATTDAGFGTTTISVGNRIDHELRTGVRFDLW